MEEENKQPEPKKEEVSETEPVDIAAPVADSESQFIEEAQSPQTPKSEEEDISDQPADSQSREVQQSSDPQKSPAQNLLGRTALDSSIYKLRKSVTTAISRSPKARTYTVVILTIVTVVFFLIFTIVPTVTAIGSLRTELNQKQETLENLKDSAKKIETHENSALNNPDKYNALNLALPAELDESAFRQNVSAMAKKYNLTLVNIKFSPDFSTPVEGLPLEFRRVDVTMSLTGDLSGFVSFLEHLENYPRLFNSRNVAYIVQDNLSGQTKELRVRGDIYLVRSQKDWQTLNESE